MASFLKLNLRVFLAFCMLMSLSLVGPDRAYAQTGAQIDNTASVSFEQGGTILVFSTNTASFVIEGARTASTIEFFRYADGADNALTTQINGSAFSPSGGLAGPFEDIGAPVTSNGLLLDLSGDVELTPADRYLAGELIFVRVLDPGQNSSPTIVESLVITLVASTGDTITLRLFESGPDTGAFFAYVPTTRDASSAPNDAILATPGSTSLTATYADSFDSTDVSVDTAIIEPFGRVFDSISGTLINGARVTIINSETGLPAEVFGVDGGSSYPSTVITGSVVSDSSGLQYPMGAGEFLFPVLLPGTYELQVEAAANYIYPSIWNESSFGTLDNAPFTIIDGSFAGQFTVEETGPRNFDVPLDGAGELVVTKTSGTPTTAIGEFVGYTIRIENRDTVPSRVRVQDKLPRGFRYREQTARLDRVRIDDPIIAEDGRSMSFVGDIILPGEVSELTYVALATAGAPLGEAVNEAVAVDRDGVAISNRAEAAVIVREDLLRSRLTIIGRVAEAACTPDDEWARETTDGFGVEGVRLYMENGAYVVTDEDGLFHFEGVLPGTHIVQVDTETLPQGYEPVICEENSRYAGSAISRFVDATGGTVWRANFYLEKTGEAVAEVEEALFADGLEYLDFDGAWLNQQTGDVAWVYPQTDRTPSTRSVNIGIKHGAYDKVELRLNGSPVSGLNFGGSETSEDSTAALSRWRGLDIENGRNIVEATVTDRFGNVRAELSESIWFVSEAERAALVADQSVLVADGRSNPVIAVRLTDSAGRPVHAGRQINVDVTSPYRLKDSELFEGEAPVTAALSNVTGVSVGPDGIARIELAPTLETGKVRLRVDLSNNPQQEIEAFLRPEKRDWILVGLAEGSLGLERLDGPGAIDANDLLNDGRIALFAKGVIRGDWLLTLAVDTAKRRGDADGDLFDGEIDPNAFFTLYGDRTFQNQEAESRYPLYVKLEKDTFQALFGDYDTDLNDTLLARYNRRLSGFKSVYEGERLSFSAFAAESNQGFARDEIAADGTSGTFVLQDAPVLRNSEQIIVETRDRFRPDEILSRLSLTRFVDYDIDFDTGEILFRRPISATDNGFNPNVIVVEYETSAAVQRNLTAGGRIAGRAFDGRVEVGATYIRQEGDDQGSNAVSQLAGIDVTAQLDKRTELHAEYATTSRDETATAEAGVGGADAFLVEVIRRQEAVTLAAYFREDDEGFGLGQQSSATGGARRFGASVTAEFGGGRDDAAQRQAAHFVDAEAYREESLQNGDSRTVVEAALRRESALFGATVGLRTVEERFAADEADSPRRSTLLTSSINKTFESLGLNVSAAHEQPIAGDESTSFPQRTTLGLDKTITRDATINVRHELLKGDNASGNNTTVGVTVRPRDGTTVTGSADLVTQDSSRRLSATVGVDQIIRINDKWSAGVGLARRANVASSGTPLDVLPDAARSPLETAPLSPLTETGSFTSAYTGLGYRGEKSALAGRLELRDSALGSRYSATLGGAREATDVLSYALAARVERNVLDEADNTIRADARLGLSYRPRAKGPVVFNRFDASYEETFNQSTNWKLVNNLGVNAVLGRRTQASVYYGFKYSKSNFLGDSFDAVTNLVGGEVRYDVTKKIDLGLSASALISDTGQVDYQIGPSVGFAPVDNTWISLGWNVEGFSDNDFQAAEFSRDGPFIKLRVKFDQHTARGLLNRISPRGR